MTNGKRDTIKQDLSKEERRIAGAVAQYAAVGPEWLAPPSDDSELGLDSTKLVSLASELRKLFPSAHKKLTVSNLIRNPNIRGIASLILSQEDSETNGRVESRLRSTSQKWKAKAEEAYGKGRVESVLPTFPVQEGVLYRSADLESLYIQHVILRLRDDINTEALEHAWKTLMATHEILR